MGKTRENLSLSLTSLETRIEGLERAIKLLLTCVKYDLSKLPSHLKPVFFSPNEIECGLKKDKLDNDVIEVTPVIKSSFSLAIPSTSSAPCSKTEESLMKHSWSPPACSDNPEPAADPDFQSNTTPVKLPGADEKVSNKTVLKRPLPPSSDENAGPSTTVIAKSTFTIIGGVDVDKVKVTQNTKRKRKHLDSRSELLEFEDSNEIEPTSTDKIPLTSTSTSTATAKKRRRQPESKRCKICNIDFKTFRDHFAHRKEYHGRHTNKSELQPEADDRNETEPTSTDKIPLIPTSTDTKYGRPRLSKTCKICNIDFRTFRDHFAHRKEYHGRHTNKSKLQPESEDQTLTSKPRWTQSKLGKRCKICKIDLETLKDHILHRREHHPRTPWRECPYCNKKIYNHSKYQIHLRRHTGQKPYLCSECGACFLDTVGLLSHQKRVHLKLKPHICKYCGSAHSTFTDLRNHEALHEGVEQHLKECPICKRKFSETNLKNHIVEVHDRIRKFECPKCDFKFKRRHHLKRHLATHDNPNRRIKGYHVYRPERLVASQRRKIVFRIHQGDPVATIAKNRSVDEGQNEIKPVPDTSS